MVNFSKSKSLYREGMSPLVKSTSRPKWQRIPPKNVFYYRCPEHKKNYVMSCVFCFDVEDDVYQFAYAFPYSYTKLQNYLQILDNRSLDYYERELLAMSVVSFSQFFFMINKLNFFNRTRQFRLEPINLKYALFTDLGLIKLFFVSFFTKIAWLCFLHSRYFERFLEKKIQNFIFCLYHLKSLYM